MPKISALPPAGTLADDDETPFVDDSASSTKKFTLAGLLVWLQSKTSWITTAMIGDAQVTAAKRTGGFKLIRFTTTGNGNVVVTGAGFTPKALLIIEHDSSHQSASVANFSLGFTDGTTQGAIGFRAQEGGDISGQIHTDRTIFLPSSGQANTNSMTFVSFNSDGFTLNMTGYTSNMTWLALVLG